MRRNKKKKNKEDKERSSWKIKGSAMVTTLVVFAVAAMVFLSFSVITPNRNWTALGAEIGRAHV